MEFNRGFKHLLPGLPGTKAAFRNFLFRSYGVIDLILSDKATGADTQPNGNPATRQLVLRSLPAGVIGKG